MLILSPIPIVNVYEVTPTKLAKMGEDVAKDGSILNVNVF